MRKRWLILLSLLFLLSLLWRENGRVSDSAVDKPFPESSAQEESHAKPLPEETPSASAEVEPGGTSSADGTAESPFRLLSCTPQETLLEFRLPAYTVEDVTDEDGALWQRIELPGAEVANAAGYPALPLYRLDYGAVPGAEVTVEIRDAEYDSLADTRPLPGRGAYFRTQEPPALVPNSSCYSAACVFPAQNASVLPVYQLRGIQGNGVMVTPFQYDSGANEVRVMTRCVIALRSTSTASATLDTQADFAAIQRQSFVNHSSFRSASKTSAVGVVGILAPDAWLSEESLQRFVSWKKSLGWQVILAGYPGNVGESAENIRTWTQALYDEHSVTHLLFLGDSTIIPPYQHNQKKTGDTIESDTYLKVYSDTSYALLAGENDLSYPDAIFGRIPVETAAELSAALTRSMTYETGAFEDSSWTTKGVYVGSREAGYYWPYRNKKDYTVVTEQQTALQNAGIMTEGTDFGLLTQDNTPEAVQEALEDGTSFLLYLGHGKCTRFVMTDYSSSQAQDLQLSGRLPFVMAPVCYSGNLEHYSKEYDLSNCKEETHSLPCLGKAFFQTSDENSGASGIVMASDETCWEPPIAQIEAFTDALKQSRADSRLGTQGAYALHALYASVKFCDDYAVNYQAASHTTTWDNGDFTQAEGIYHAWIMEFLGDPTGVLRVGPQSPLQAEVESTADALTVTVTGFEAETPSPVANAIVALQTKEGIVAGRTDASGEVVLACTQEEYRDGVIVRVLDASGPMQEFTTRKLDADGNGAVSNAELAVWLEWWEEFQEAVSDTTTMVSLRDEAIREWQESPDSSEDGEIEESSGSQTEQAIFSPKELRVVLEREEGLLESLAERGFVLESMTADTVTALVTETEFQWLDLEGWEWRSCTDFVPTAPALAWEEVLAAFQDATRKHWPAIRTTSLDRSAGGRQMTGLRISLAEDDSAVHPQLLVFGGFRGDAPEATRQLLQLLEALEEGVTGNSAATAELLRNAVVWLLPCMNPDGYALGTPCNSDGIPLEWGFPQNPGTLAAGDATQCYRKWSFPSCVGTQLRMPQPEQKALAEWRVAHPIHASVQLCQGDEYVTYEEDSALALANALAEGAGIASIQSAEARYPVKGTFGAWQTGYFGTQALTLSFHAASAEITQGLLTWMKECEKGCGGTVTDAVTGNALPYARIDDASAGLSLQADSRGRYWCIKPDAALLFQHDGYRSSESDALMPDSPAVEFSAGSAQYLPSVPKEQRLSCVEAGKALVLRVEIPVSWQATAISSEEFLGSRSRDGVLDLAFLKPDGIQEAKFLLTPASAPAEEGRLLLTVNTAGQEVSRARIAVPPPSEEFSLNLSNGWNFVSVPLQGISVGQLEGRTAMHWQDGVFQEISSEAWLSPGRGFLLKNEGTGVLTLTGWRCDAEAIVLAAGMHLLGPQEEYSVDDGIPRYRVQDKVFRRAPAKAVLVPGEAYWRYLESQQEIFP